jgi:hypothetical protein
MKKLFTRNLNAYATAPGVLVVLILFLFLPAVSQNKDDIHDFYPKRKVAKIYLVNGQKAKGTILLVSDSSLQLRNGATYTFREIDTIKVRGKFAIGIGLGAGAAAGLIVGLLLPAKKDEVTCDPNDPLCGDGSFGELVRRLEHGILGAVIGAGAGAIAGAATMEKFKIGAQHVKFVSFRNKLMSGKSNGIAKKKGQ